MKNFISVNKKDKSLQDLFNDLQNYKWEKKEYLRELSKVEQNLCLFYDASFSIKIEEKDRTIQSIIYLNGKVLLKFNAEF